MNSTEALLLFMAAVVGAGVNAVAGGGGLVAFPALVFTGADLIGANAVTMVALWPGNLASMGAYRRHFSLNRKTVLPLMLMMALGGGIGAWLAVLTPPSLFKQVVPFLLLLTTVLFIGGPYLNHRMQRLTTVSENHPVLLAGLLLVGLYGGYFGSGLGILLLAVLSLFRAVPLMEQNALKVALVFCNNSVAACTFMASGTILWPQALVMIAGAILGGYGGAFLGQRLHPVWLRRTIVGISSAMTIYFFVRS